MPTVCAAALCGTSAPTAAASTAEPARPVGGAACPQEIGQLDLAATIEQVPGVPLADDFGAAFSILEGPVWLEGTLFFSHISTQSQPNPARIYKWELGAAPQVFLADAGTNGLARVAADRLLAGRHQDGSVVSIAVATGEVTVVSSGYQGQAFNSPNDLAVRSDGNVYFTDPEHQRPRERAALPTRVYRLDSQAQLSVVDDTLNAPNGVALSIDEEHLYVSQRGPLMHYSVAADGSVSEPQALRAERALEGGDGMTSDCAGRLYWSNGNRIVVLDVSDPQQVQELGSFTFQGVQQVTNAAFGGPNRSTLYVTSLGPSPRLFSLELGVVGRVD